LALYRPKKPIPRIENQIDVTAAPNHLGYSGLMKVEQVCSSLLTVTGLLTKVFDVDAFHKLIIPLALEVIKPLGICRAEDGHVQVCLMQMD
jgi:hypothetical protein